jgi:hypothetical protein
MHKFGRQHDARRAEKQAHGYAVKNYFVAGAIRKNRRLS